MSRPLLLITAPFDERVASALSDAFKVRQVEPVTTAGSLADGPHAAHLAEAEVIVTELDEVDERTLDAAPRLRAVVSCRANPVNVDLAACERRGVTVLTTPGRNADVTADLAFALLLAVVRHLTKAEQWMRAGNWSTDDVYYPYETFRGIALRDRVLGIVGGGAIGRRMAERARGFGMRSLVYDPFLTQEQLGDLGTLASLDEVMSTSDVVTIHAPLNDQTRGLIGDRELRLMRPDAVLINAGRAAIVEEQPLLDALREKRIAGAGMDVFWEEPLPADHPLFELDNVTLTPHIAGASDDVVTMHSRIAEQRLREWLAA